MAQGWKWRLRPCYEGLKCLGEESVLVFFFKAVGVYQRLLSKIMT